MVSPADLTWGRQDVLAQPDVFVIGAANAAVRSWLDVRHVPFVTEATSPSTRHFDRFQKRTLYRDRDVAEYWIIDPEASLAEVWSPTAQFPVVKRDRLTWHPAGAKEPLAISLRQLFSL